MCNHLVGDRRFGGVEVAEFRVEFVRRKAEAYSVAIERVCRAADVAISSFLGGAGRKDLVGVSIRPDRRHCFDLEATELFPEHLEILAVGAVDGGAEEGLREVDGEKQYLATDDGLWQKVPDGHIAHPLGRPIGKDKLDIVLTVVMRYANTTIQTREPQAGIHVMPVELARFDYEAFEKTCEGTLPKAGLVVMR